MSVSFDDDDKEFRRIQRDMKALRGAFATAGIHEGAGSYPGGPTVAEVALFNEFGTETAPERSFIRATMDINKRKIADFAEFVLNDVILGLKTPKQAVNSLGFFGETLIKNRIQTSRNWAIPNTPAVTNAKIKGGAVFGPTPLIRSTLLLRSVTSRGSL